MNLEKHGLDLHVTALIQYIGESSRVLAQPKSHRNSQQERCLQETGNIFGRLSRHYRSYLKGKWTLRFQDIDYRILLTLIRKYGYTISARSLRTISICCFNPELTNPRTTERVVERLRKIYDLLKKLSQDLRENSSL